MKLTHAIFGLGAASLLPTALAQAPASPEALPYTITIRSDVTPVAFEGHRYPAYAGAERLEGACEVTFAISTAGKADGIDVGACTSNAFRRAAKAAVEGMSFAPREKAIDGIRLNIAWKFDREAGIHTASLN